MTVKPLNVIKNEVSATEVGKYYLKVELSKLFTAEEMKETIDNIVDTLGEHDFWRLLEAMSFTFRLNGIFWAVSNTKYTWSEEEWAPKDVTYGQIRPAIDKITFSPKIAGNPVKFRDYLQKYFEEHPSDDPKGLEQFRPNPKRSIPFEKLFLVEQQGKVELLDGSNRIIAGLMRGQEKIVAFIGRTTNPDGKYKIGDSTIWLLGRTYLKSAPENKDAVLKTIELLIDSSTDGKDAALSYWLPNIHDPELKKKCQELVNTKK